MFSISSLAAPFRRGDRRRSALRSLHGLSAAQLADLGIPPDGIDFFVETMLAQNEHRPDARGQPAASALSRIGPFAVSSRA